MLVKDRGRRRWGCHRSLAGRRGFGRGEQAVEVGSGSGAGARRKKRKGRKDNEEKDFI